MTAYMEEPRNWFQELIETEEMLYALCKKTDINIIKEDQKLYSFWLKQLREEEDKLARIEQLKTEAKKKLEALSKLSIEEQRILGLIK